MKLMYAGELSGSCLDRQHALARLGFQVYPFNFSSYMIAGGPIARRIRTRLLRGNQIARLNADLLTFNAEIKPDFVWFDKPVGVCPETIDALRAKKATLINYVIDNPYVANNGPGWRLIRSTIPLYDINVVPRPVNVADYTAAGAKTVVLMPLSFDPMEQFPRAINETEKTVPLSFIGAPYDRRPQFLTTLARAGVPVVVWGSARWRRHIWWIPPGFTFRPPAYREEYRKAIWTSCICLGFVTHQNRDTWAHRSFEISACGTFLLAEHTEDHAKMFEPGREAEFFQSVGEVLDKVRFYRQHENHREAIARAGCLRAWKSGYSNDERIATAFAEIDPTLGAKLKTTARATIASRRTALAMDLW